MGKKLIITLIILLVIIVVSLIAFLVLCLNGTIDFHNFKISFGTRKSEELIFNETYDIEKFTTINVKHDAGDIIFENCEENIIKVEIYGEDEEAFEVNTNNEELKIDYTKNNGGFLNFNNVTGDVKIYIPVSYNGNIKIENDAGEIKIGKIENSNVDIDCDAGNIEIDSIKNATINCDAGNVEINNLLNKCNIKVDAGNLEIENAELNEDSDIKSNMGNIRIKNINDIYVQGHVDLGKCTISDNNRKSDITLKINSDMGNIEVENMINKK